MDVQYPDANVPTLLVYHAGACVKHLAGLNLFGGQRASPERECRESVARSSGGRHCKLLLAWGAAGIT